jgi:UDP-N-acetylglucosamine--N-acetylmuramyl-(pentapeptide) pyrophosphoryl-undecaprenol N-acetylglucosamine transferase
VITLVIAGGGTGGHLFPGIAVARELLRRMPDAHVSFVGTARGLEARVIPAEGLELDVIRSTGLKGKSIAARARGAALVPAGLFDAWHVLTRRRPHVVMGVGGYSSGPVVMAAAIRRIPTLVLEQNAVPGLTNRLLAPWVRAAAVTYEQTQSFFRGKAFVTGNPVRAEFFETSKFELRSSKFRTVLVLGGSQGAHAINVAMMGAGVPLMQRIPGLSLVHQTGERDLAEVRSAYQRAGVTARVEPFLSAVAREMAAADVVISRAGATTLAELAAAGRAAVLIPFPGASDDHQRRNAELLAAAHAATVIDERDLTTDRLVEVTAGIVEDDQRRARMATSMRGFARPDAAAQIVDRILALAGHTGRQAA